jgi:hypothetical protein
MLACNAVYGGPFSFGWATSQGCHNFTSAAAKALLVCGVRGRLAVCDTHWRNSGAQRDRHGRANQAGLAVSHTLFASARL